MANPIPSVGISFEAHTLFSVFNPINVPVKSNNGPPLFPGLIAASCWILDAVILLITPTVTVLKYSISTGVPIAITCWPFFKEQFISILIFRF